MRFESKALLVFAITVTACNSNNPTQSSTSSLSEDGCLSGNIEVRACSLDGMSGEQSFQCISGSFSAISNCQLKNNGTDAGVGESDNVTVPEVDEELSEGEYATNSIDVIYSNDFTNSTLGNYSPVRFNQEWKSTSGNRIEEMIIESHSGNNYLKIEYPFYTKPFFTVHNYTSGSLSTNTFSPVGTSTASGIGPSSGGGQVQTSLGQSYNELYLGYRIYIPSNFNGADGGKLPGLCGGNCPSGGGTSDSNCDGSSDGFSTRYMWSRNVNPFVYMYEARHMTNPPCSSSPKIYGTNLSSVEGTNIQNIPFVKGQWNSIIQRVVMNNPSNTANGLVEVWLNGNLIIQKSGVTFRKGNASFGIDKLAFSTFFGGGAGVICPANPSTTHPCYNPVTKAAYRYPNGELMELYAPRKDESISFDDIIVFKFKESTSVPRNSVKSPIDRKLFIPQFSGLKTN